MRLALVVTILVGALFASTAQAQPRDKDTPIPVSVQNRARAEALNYWVHIDPAYAPILNKATVKWTTKGLCEGFSGCALINGCIINYPPYCWVAVCGKCYFAWFGGYDWLVGTLKHEMGHLLGFNHGDPTCTMNVEYC